MLWEQCTYTNINMSFPTDYQSIQQVKSPAFSLEFVLVLPELIYMAFICGKHHLLLPVSLHITKNSADSLICLQVHHRMVMSTDSLYNKYMSHTPVVGNTDVQQTCGLQNYTTKQLLPCLLFSSPYYCSVLFN